MSLPFSATTILSERILSMETRGGKMLIRSMTISPAERAKPISTAVMNMKSPPFQPCYQTSCPAISSFSRWSSSLMLSRSLSICMMVKTAIKYKNTTPISTVWPTNP